MYRLIPYIRRATLAGAALLAAACAPLAVSEQDNGGSIKLHPGRSLELRLHANPSTGYTWDVTSFDPAVLKQVKVTETQPSEHAAPGAPVIMVLQFQAVARGHTALLLVNHREWERNTPPAQTFALDVNVE